MPRPDLSLEPSDIAVLLAASLAGFTASIFTAWGWPFLLGLAVAAAWLGRRAIRGSVTRDRRWTAEIAVAGAAFALTWALLPQGGRVAPFVFALAAVLGVRALRAWWRSLGVEEVTRLHDVEKIPLELSHPFLQLRVTRTVAGRVTIVVDGIAKDLAIETRRRTGEATLEQRSGDPAFDAQLRVTGNSLTCRSLLDPLTRDALRQAFADFPGLSVTSGTLSWSGRPADVHGSASRLLDLAGRLVSPDLLAGLEKSALTDPAPAMRQRSLELLISRFGANPETRRIATAALGDTEPILRLRAAIYLGDGAQEHLAALASTESYPAEIRAEAVRNAGLLPKDVAATIVRDALTDRRELVRISAIVTAGKLKLASCNGRLATLVRRAEPPQQLTIVEAAAATEHESAEAPLLAALESESGEVKLAAVRALALLGTIKSVEPLLALRGTQLLAGEIGPAAGAAVLAIQARLAGAGAGQLALTEASGGAVSFPAAERGSLTVPEGDAGGLTLTQEEVEGVVEKRPARRQPT